MTNKAYLLTGGNLGDRHASLALAKEMIEAECGPVILQSGLYETAAWGKTDQPSFYNQALVVETKLEPRQLLRHLLRIEKKIGRIRKEKYGPRVIDIDILLYNDEVHRYALLKLPHPEMANRRFVLTPLAEIAPDLEHPVLYKTITQLLAECPDPLEVQRIA